MSFRRVLEQVSQLGASTDQVLRSSRFACQRGDLLAMVRRLGEILARCLPETGPVEYRCPNNLIGALGLFALLDRGFGCVLVPANHEGAVIRMCGCALVVAGDDPNRDPSEWFSVQHPDSDSLDAIPDSECEVRSREITALAGKLMVRTSGSLGRAKWVVHSPEQLLRNARHCAERLGLSTADRVMIPAPIFHMYGLGAGLLPAILAGSSVALVDRANILNLFECEAVYEPNVAFLTPALCRGFIATRKQPRPYSLTVTAGDVLRPEVFERYEERFGPLVNLYGSSELGVIAASSPEDDVAMRRLTVGRPLPGVFIECRSQGVFEEHDTGELWVNQRFGFDGYIDEAGGPVPDLADRRPGAIFATGDLGRPIGDCWQILGRCDHSANRDGRLVLFSEIEQPLEKLRGMDQVCVVASGDHARGTRLIAYCVPERRGGLTTDHIRKACFDILPRFAVPDQVIVLDHLPQLANGKVDRRVLARHISEDGRAKDGRAEDGRAETVELKTVLPKTVLPKKG